MSKAKRLIGIYQSVYRSVNQIEKMTSCHYVKQKAGLEWSEGEKVLLHKASTQFYNAQREFDQVMSAKIGEQVTREVRRGEWQ